MENISQMSMLEAAINLMEQKKNPQPINKILEETLELKGLDDPNGELAAQLYVDITTSSKFVYMGNEEWDLKSRQSLDWWDKDGSAFNTAESTDSNENELSTDDFNYDEDKDEDSDDDYSNDEVTDDYSENEDDEDYSDNDEYDRITENPDDDYDDENDFDEEDYEGYMDDYENLYDK